MKKVIKSIGLLPIFVLGLLFGAPVQAETVTANEVAQLLAADRYGNDKFGHAVAVDGDTAFIGSPGDDDLGAESGSVYVFMRDSEGMWSNSQKLLASNGAGRTNLGSSIALDGDTALVGSLRGGGTAYVFMRDSAGVWSEQQQLRPSDYDPLNPAWFSYAAVALDGDTAIICAHRDNIIGLYRHYAGSAYVFTRDSSGLWSEQQKLIASDVLETEGNDGFCTSADLDGNSAVIGVPGSDIPAHSQGAAYLFSRDSSGWWAEQQKIIASDGDGGEFFGWSVAVNGGQVVIGAPGEIVIPNVQRTQHGAAYVFTQDNTGTWVEQQKLFASDLGSSINQFGLSMTMESSTVVIGAPGCSFPNYIASAGAVYLFTYSSGIWTEQVKLIASDQSAGDRLGGGYGGGGSPTVVGLSGSTILAGASMWDMKETWGTSAGAAYVFDFITNTPPVAEAGVNQSIHVGDLVLLDGSGSSDAETDSLDLVYIWQFELVPSGSLVELIDADTMNPSFTPDMTGDYLLSLTVTDEGDFSSEPDEVLVSSLNTPPNADAGEDQGALVWSIVYLDGSGSFDPDEDVLSYAWSMQQMPTGSMADLIDAHTVSPRFQPDLAGTYDIELVVNDAYADSDPDTVSVLVADLDDYICERMSNAVNLVADMPKISFTTKGNKKALSNFLRLSCENAQLEELDEAQHKLEQALSRTDGCILRGAVDESGGGPAPKKDFIIYCSDQEVIYELVLEALDSLVTPLP